MKSSHFRPSLIALLCSAGFLQADIVTLKEGKKLEGNILSENETSIRMRYKLTPKIWDEKDIPRSDIADILKQAPEEVEIIELRKALPTPDLMSAEKYEALIQDRLRPFVNRYPGTPQAAEVDKMIAQVQEEKEKVVAGGIKLEGKWLSPEEAKAESFNVKAYGLFTEMKDAEEAKNYNGVMKAFGKLSNPQGGYIASIYYPEAVELALGILDKYEAQVEQMIKDQPSLQKQRVDNEKRLVEPDLSRFKEAVSREKEQWKAAYDAERKLEPKWFTPYKYDISSLKTLSANIIAEKTRLKELQLPVISKVNTAIANVMRADPKASKEEEELKKMGDAILAGESAAADLDMTSKQYYGQIFQAYRQRYAYAQQQLALIPLQKQAQAQAEQQAAAAGSAAIGGTAAPGMDARVAAALAAAGGEGTAQPAPATGTVPATGVPQQVPVMGTAPVAQQPVPGAVAPAPGMAPQVAPSTGYPQAAPNGYPQQQPPMGAPPVMEEEAPVGGLSTNTLLLIGMGVLVLVLVISMSGGKKK
ncbi:MAG: PTPDL family protein [Prosthecobacter sp.]